MGKDFPKFYKYTLYDKMLSLSVDLLEPLEMANRSIGEPMMRKMHIESFLGKFNTLRALFRICNEKKLISLKMTARLATLTQSIGKQATSWKNSNT